MAVWCTVLRRILRSSLGPGKPTDLPSLVCLFHILYPSTRDVWWKWEHWVTLFHHNCPAGLCMLIDLLQPIKEWETKSSPFKDDKPCIGLRQWKRNERPNGPAVTNQVTGWIWGNSLLLSYKRGLICHVLVPRPSLPHSFPLWYYSISFSHSVVRLTQMRTYILLQCEGMSGLKIHIWGHS